MSRFQSARHDGSRRYGFRSALLTAAVLAVAAGTQAGAVTAKSAIGTATKTVDWLARSESGALPGFDPGLADLDQRGPWLAPSAERLAAAKALNVPVSISWTQYGTPKTLVASTVDGWLGSGYRGGAVDVARAWLSQHATLMGLRPADVADLELINDAPLGAQGHAVLLRQRFSGIDAAQDGQVAVGVRGSKVASVTSSLVAMPVSINTLNPKLTPQQAFVAAAKEVGLDVRLKDLSLSPRQQADFVTLGVKGLAQPGLTRLRALPTTRGEVRLAYETDVQNTVGGAALAYVSFVDAVTGDILYRHNATEQYSADGQFSGASSTTTSLGTTLSGRTPFVPSGGTINASYSFKDCGKPVPLTVPAGTRQIIIQIDTIVPINDVILLVFRGTHNIVNEDTGVAEEVSTPSLDPPAAAGESFTAQFCPQKNSTVPQQDVGPYTVVGAYVNLDQNVTGGAGNTPFPAKWKYFESNPALPGSAGVNNDLRTEACWQGTSGNPSASKTTADCQRQVANINSRLAWDIDPNTGVPTFTTIGNNATTAQAWLSPLTPADSYRPVSATRDYLYPWTNQWLTSRCDPNVFATPNRNDIDPNVVNLFTGHNRIHDFSYRLGFTERNYNLQTFNFGETAAKYQNDAEVGNVQAGALSGAPAATGLGRDNANQITLQDGVPGITNQYLFQPVTGFWAPCVDGDLDGLIFGHEYTHAISNRMIAGPDTGLSGVQGGAMGESWSDLNATEYLNATGVAGSTGADPYSAGAYATNNKIRAIRDYNLLQNPLMYGDIGFDTTGPEVHADGEIWNGVQMHVRQQLIDYYNLKGLKASDRKLQLSCAFGIDYKHKGAPYSGFDGCPGNRRWIQYIYDAWLLQANGSPSYVDMKNAMLAADKVRTGGVDQAVMATAFAQRGLGVAAVSPPSDDNERPDFASPVSRTNSRVTFKVVDATTGQLVGSTIWVGRFSARATPYLSTKPGKVGSAVFTAGHYEFVVRALGYGLSRATATIVPGRDNVVTVRLDPNFASISRGAKISGDGVRLSQMIDEDEGTNGGYNGLTTASSKTGPAQGVAIAGKSWTVALAGGRHTITRLNLSTLHHPASTTTEVADFQGRTLGLRAFDVQVSSDGGRTYHKVYSSPSDAFPAGYPRPVAPDLIIRSFLLPQPVVADHVRIVVRTNQCTGAPAYQGDQDNDPTNNSDCKLSNAAFQVIVSEIEVFGGNDSTATPGRVRA